MKAMNWEVYVSPYNGLSYGQFAVAWGSSHVVIHTLNASEFISTPCDQLYIDKLSVIMECLSEFIDLLGTKNIKQRREWINPIETGATGSVAYCYSVIEGEAIIYFELASCTDKVRFYPAQTGSNRLRNLKTCMSRLLAELEIHKQAMLSSMSVVNETRAMLKSVNKA